MEYAVAVKNISCIHSGEQQVFKHPIGYAAVKWNKVQPLSLSLLKKVKYAVYLWDIFYLWLCISPSA